MDIIKLFRKIESSLQIKGREEYKKSVKEQKAYIANLGVPRDDIERSFFQYKSQMFIRGKKGSFALSIGAFGVYFLIKAKYKRNKQKFIYKKPAVFLPDGKPSDVIPLSLSEKYSGYELEEKKGYTLSISDVQFLKKIERRYSGQWFFLLKIMVKIARYSYLIARYRPEALIVCNEYSFTSSVMRLYCKSKNVKLINVMHGEKIYCISDSFFKFDKCYVWDKYYVELFCKLMADKKQFVVEIPPALNLDLPQIEKQYDYTYYLTDERDEVLKNLFKLLHVLCNEGNRVCVRPHPRYSDLEDVRKLCGSSLEYEDPYCVSLSNSLAMAKKAVSFASTVLNQAHNNGIPVVIDDITRPYEFLKLKETEYIMLKLEHLLLSELL